MGRAHAPLTGHSRTYTRPGRERPSDLGAGAKGGPPALCSLELAVMVLGREKAAPDLGPQLGADGGGPGSVPTRALSVPGVPSQCHGMSPPGGPRSQVGALCCAGARRPACLPAVVACGVQIRLQGYFRRPNSGFWISGQKVVEREVSKSGWAVRLSNVPSRLTRNNPSVA